MASTIWTLWVRNHILRTSRKLEAFYMSSIPMKRDPEDAAYILDRDWNSKFLEVLSVDGFMVTHRGSDKGKTEEEKDDYDLI